MKRSDERRRGEFRAFLFVEQKNGILKNIVFKYMQKSMIFKNYILLCAELEDQQKNSIFQNYFCSGFGF